MIITPGSLVSLIRNQFISLYQIDKITAIAVLFQGIGNFKHLLRSDQIHAVGDLFQASDLQTLLLLDHLDKVCCLKRVVVITGDIRDIDEGIEVSRISKLIQRYYLLPGRFSAAPV